MLLHDSIFLSNWVSICISISFKVALWEIIFGSLLIFAEVIFIAFHILLLLIISRDFGVLLCYLLVGFALILEIFWWDRIRCLWVRAVVVFSIYIFWFFWCSVVNILPQSRRHYGFATEFIKLGLQFRLHGCESASVGLEFGLHIFTFSTIIVSPNVFSLFGSHCILPWSIVDLFWFLRGSIKTISMVEFVFPDLIIRSIVFFRWTLKLFAWSVCVFVE